MLGGANQPNDNPVVRLLKALVRCREADVHVVNRKRLAVVLDEETSPRSPDHQVGLGDFVFHGDQAALVDQIGGSSNTLVRPAQLFTPALTNTSPARG